MPVSSSTIKDCERGSLHPIVLSGEVVVPVTLLEITSVPKVLLTLLSSNSCLCSILALRIEIIFSWTVSRTPDAEYGSSAIVVARFWSLSSSLTKVKTCVPVSNFGWLILFGFGI